MLSGGEQQRLALARAWALRPEVLFLDEPTASLDPGATHEIEKVIAAMHAAGTKIVMVTHNLGQAQRLGDEVLFLHQGRLVERAPAPTVSSAARRRPRPPNSSKESCHGNRPSDCSSRCCSRSSRSPSRAQERFITVASTTSTEQSGLFGYLLPIFEKKTGIKVRVVALGTGQALDLARRGDADVVFVHAKAAEEKFLAEGHGVERIPVMYNDFVLIGPKSDPAKVAGGKDIVEALKKIQAAQAPFVSRGDRSGTHMAELDLWKARASTSTRRRARGIATPGRAWDPRSTPPRR